MPKEYFITPYAMVLHDAPVTHEEARALFDDLHHLFLKKFVAFKDHAYDPHEAKTLKALLSELLEIQAKLG